MFFMMFFDEKIRKTKEETETKPVGNVSKSCYSSSSLESLVFFSKILWSEIEKMNSEFRTNSSCGPMGRIHRQHTIENTLRKVTGSHASLYV